MNYLYMLSIPIPISFPVLIFFCSKKNLFRLEEVRGIKAYRAAA